MEQLQLDVGAALLAGVTAAGTAAVLARHTGLSRRGIVVAAVLSAVVTLLAWGVYSYDFFLYGVRENGPSYYPFSSYVEYREAQKGAGGIAIGAGYCLFAGSLVAITALVHDRATGGWSSLAALVACAAVVLPAVVPALLPRLEYGKDPVFHAVASPLMHTELHAAVLCLRYGVERPSAIGSVEEKGPVLCIHMRPTPTARSLIKGPPPGRTATVDVLDVQGELNDSRVHPYDRVERLDLKGLDVVASEWPGAPPSLSKPIDRPEPRPVRPVGDRETKKRVRRLERHLVACGRRTGSFLGCIASAKPSLLGIPLGMAPGQVSVGQVTQDDFTMVGYSSNETDFTATTRNGRAQRRSCSPASHGGCPASGYW